MLSNHFRKKTENRSTGKLPVLFLGHGSPMNAIEENEFVRGFRSIAETFEKPKAVLCISAHWETRGTCVTAMQHPRTIHDFGGFPCQLFEVRYPAPGSPTLAEETKELVQSVKIGLDYKWGLDHGAWSVLRHMYPDADIPVVQMSLDYGMSPHAHYELARKLKKFRDQGVLVIGSGNMVHNLGRVAWDRLNDEAYGYEWAVEANEQMKAFILEGNHPALLDYTKQGKAIQLAIPTPEHFIPLLYALALGDPNEETAFFNDKTVAGSLAMTSIKIG